MQALYGILAMAVVAILSLTVMRASRSTDTSIRMNEITTQMSAVGVDVLEAIASEPFDSQTDTTKVSTFPAVTSPTQLTPEADFGGCASFSACEDVDDFDDLTFTRSLDGFTYSIEIQVRYVDEDSPDVYTGSQTYAKEVRALITNQHVYLGDPSNLLTVEMRRVVAYDKVTSA